MQWTWYLYRRRFSVLIIEECFWLKSLRSKDQIRFWPGFCIPDGSRFDWAVSKTWRMKQKRKILRVIKHKVLAFKLVTFWIGKINLKILLEGRWSSIIERLVEERVVICDANKWKETSVIHKERSKIDEDTLLVDCSPVWKGKGIKGLFLVQMFSFSNLHLSLHSGNATFFLRHGT